MKTNQYNRYSYSELLTAATGPNATQSDIDTLGSWFADFGTQYWNGECYEAGAYNVFPIFEEVEEDQYEVVRYELR